jgi:hypothetical protein
MPSFCQLCRGTIQWRGPTPLNLDGTDHLSKCAGHKRSPGLRRCVNCGSPAVFWSGLRRQALPDRPTALPPSAWLLRHAPVATPLIVHVPCKVCRTPIEWQHEPCAPATWDRTRIAPRSNQTRPVLNLAPCRPIVSRQWSSRFPLLPTSSTPPYAVSLSLLP